MTYTRDGWTAHTLPALTQFTVVRHDQIPAGVEWGGGLATCVDRQGVIGQRADAPERWTLPTKRDDGRAGVVLLATEIRLWIARRNAMAAMSADASYVRIESLQQTAAPTRARHDHAPEIATAREPWNGAESGCFDVAPLTALGRD